MLIPGPAEQLCGHPDGCDQPATHQAQRPATEQEATAHWDALEQNIRAHGNPDYVQRRDDTVTVAEHRCDDPDHADQAYLEAVAAKDSYDRAMADLATTAGRFSTQQLQQLTSSIRQLTEPGAADV